MKVTRIRSERNSRRTKVAAYVRVSTLNDNQDDSYEAQAEYYDKKIRANPDWDHAGIYCDRLSGTHTENREEFKRLVQDAIDRKADIILCKSVSRWARNTLEGLENIREIGGAGAKVIFEQECIDTSQPGSDFQLNLAAAVAQMESESISENMKLSYRNRAAQGKFIANRGAYFGFNTDDNTFRPDGNAGYVEMIFNDYLKGMRFADIARKLNNMGVKNSRGREWKGSSVSSILKNEVYVGDVRFQKTPARDVITGEIDEIQACRYIRNHHKGIIRRSVWDRTQRKLMNRPKRKRYIAEELKEIDKKVLALHEKGLTKKQMLAEGNLNTGQLENSLKRLRADGRIKDKNTEAGERLEKVFGMVNEGMKPEEIADKLGVCSPTVRRDIRKLKEAGRVK